MTKAFYQLTGRPQDGAARRAVYPKGKRPMSRLLFSLFATVLLVAGCESDKRSAADTASASADSRPARTTSGTREPTVTNMVEWLQPAVADLPLRSEEEKQRGMEFGRELPRPELLQPRLDENLPAFVPALDPAIQAEYTGGASDVLPGLVLAWIERFKSYYPNVSIEIAKPYAGSLGMLEVIDETFDFVFVSRELKPTDISSFEEKFGHKPFSTAVAGGSYRHYGFLDAMGFFVHVDNPLDRLSFDQIDAIFSSTRHRGGKAITTWGDLGLGGEWRDRPINLYGIEPWNGFEEFVRQRALSVGEQRGEWREDINFSHVVFPLAEQVAADPNGLGYTGLAYVTRGVKMLPISAETGGDYVAPSYDNVANASYPLSRLIYFNTNKNPGSPLPPVLDELVRFLLSGEGQQVVLDQAIYLPLRSWQAEASRAVLD